MSSTPSQEEAMETVTNTKIDAKNIQIDVAKAGGMSMTSKLAHSLAIIVSAVIALAVSSVLADGTSVIRLKDPQYLPIATNPALKSVGINHRLDQLLGPTYGIGLHHDQSGHSWTNAGAGNTLKELIANLGVPTVAAAIPYVIANDDLKHPVPFLSCDHLQMAGLAAMWLGFIAEAVAVVMVIFHTLALAGLLPAKPAKLLGGLIWFVLTAGFLIVILLAEGIYNATWECDQPVVPTITISDHFDFNYGFVYALVGFASALLIFCVVLAATSMQEGAPAPKTSGVICKVLVGVFVGVVVAIIGSCATLGGAETWAAKPAPDPTINPCEGQKPYHAGPGDNYFANVDCMKEEVTQVLEQAGANVTRGYKGLLDAADRVPITGSYADEGLCPVNVHWHLGTEHLSVGEYDEHGHGPAFHGDDHHRQLAAGKEVRGGYQCHHYKADDAKFTTEYDWKHCVDMKVGQTYEIHWPHSAAGACGTDWQYQSPFYDGVFCRDGVITLAPLNTYKKIGVQAQIFTIVNDESYYNGHLIDGMIIEGSKGQDIAKYTGSTTGTSRNNQKCSRYTPITWQVDRKCHMISASSFDKLCQDMKGMKDDMSMDYHAHGSRELVASQFVANNQQSRKK